jgi:aryl-alcohol dehydrogenase
MSFYGCGNCINCLKGIPTQCLNYAANNLSGVRPDGSAHFTENGHDVADMFDQSSFTTTTVVRERNAVKVPKDLDLRELGPLGCGYVTGSGTVFNTLKPEPGSTIAVFGTGAVGLAAMMAGRISGCTKVIAVDIVPSRLKLAKELGATDTINSKDQDAVKAIQDLTDGHGVDYAVDTTGVKKVMEDSIQALAQGGTTATIAVTDQHIDLDTWNDLCTSDRKVVGVNMGDSIPQVDVPRLIRFYQLGMFDFDKTEKFYKFEDINQANADSVSGKTIKPVLVIDQDYKPGE